MLVHQIHFTTELLTWELERLTVVTTRSGVSLDGTHVKWLQQARGHFLQALS